MLMNPLSTKPNKILSGLFRQMVAVNIVINLIQPCNQLIDTILTGQAYGADALQVYALFLPVSSFLTAASCFFSKGTQITCSHLMGRGKISESDKALGTAACMGLAVPVLFMMLMILFSKQLSVLLGASADIAGQIQDMSGYLTAYALGIPAIFLLDTLMCLLQLEGKRNAVVYASLCILITNALGDLANIYVFEMGLAGMALATSLANIFAFVFVLIFFMKRTKMLHLSLRNFHWNYVRKIAVNGTPSLTYYGSLVIRTAIMNALVLTGLSRGTLVSLVVVNNFAVVADVIIGGWGDAVLLLGGVLYGEKDRSGARALLKLSGISGALCMGVLTVITIIFAVPISRVFIKADEISYIDMTVRAVSITAFYLVPDILQCITKKYIQAIGCPTYTSVTNFLTNVIYCCGCALVLVKIMGSDGLFLSYTVCYIMAMISNIVFVMHVSGKKYDIREDDYLTYNIESLAECTQASESVYHYCIDKGMQKRKCFLISLFVEEMSKNIVEHGFRPEHDNEVMVKIIPAGDTMTVSFKDTCTHFDPICYYEKVDEGSVADSGFGIKLIMKLSKNVVYTSNFNLNNLLVEV